MVALDEAGVPVLGQKPTQKGIAPDMSGAYPSLAGLTPLYDRVIVLPIKPGETHGSLVIPETVADSWPFGVGRVLAVGAGRIAHSTGDVKPLTVEAGDVVVYDKKAGFELPWDDDLEVVCLQEPAILGRMPRWESSAP